MTKKILMSTMLLLVMCLGFVSCSDDKDQPTATSSVVINLEMPLTIQGGELTDAQIVLINKKSAQPYTTQQIKKTDNGYTATIENVPVGSYSVVAVGTAKFTVDGKQTTTGKSYERECRDC